MENDLCVGIAQTGIVWEDRQASLDQLDSMLVELPSCDVLLLPETFTTGFSMNAEDLAEEPNGPTTEWMRAKAHAHQVAILGSVIIRIGDTYRNRLLFVKPDGRVDCYDKRHLFAYAGEDKVFTPGDKRLVVKWKGWRICPMICYDLRFPAWSRNFGDYDLLVYVANWPKPRMKHWNVLLQARAVENQSYVAACNRIGSDGNDIQYTGDSGIWDYHGDQLVEASDRNGIFRAQLSAEALLDYREKLPFLKDRDKFSIEYQYSCFIGKLISMIRFIFICWMSTLSMAFCSCENDDPQTAEKVTAQSSIDSNYVGPHYAHHESTANLVLNSENQWDSLHRWSGGIPRNITRFHSDLKPTTKLFGWHMYKHGSSYKQYPWDMLWGIAYFGYMIDPKTGGFKNIYQWRTTSMADSAKAHGTELYLTAGLYGSDDIKQFLSNPPAIDRFIATISQLLQERSATGINIDFEGIPKGYNDKLTEFVQAVSKRFKSQDPPCKVSLAIYANDWNRVFDIQSLNSYVDFYTLMAYDYYGGFSKRTGPVSPTRSSAIFGAYSMDHSIQYYLDQGMPKQQMIVGLPLYGAIWSTSDSNVPGRVLDFKRHIPYGEFEHNYMDSIGFKMTFENTSINSYAIHKNAEGTFDQYWVDDLNAMRGKVKSIKEKNLAGIAFWSLGYALGSDSLWHMLNEELNPRN